MKTDKERISALETDLGNHKEQCTKDKAALNDELKGINGKLWAGLVLILLQFIGLTGYLAVKGAPWFNQAAAAEVAGR